MFLRFYYLNLDNLVSFYLAKIITALAGCDMRSAKIVNDILEEIILKLQTIDLIPYFKCFYIDMATSNFC